MSGVISCPAGYKSEAVRSGRSITAKCVVDTATMNRPDHNLETRRTTPPSYGGTSSTKQSGTVPKKSTAAKKVKNDPCDSGDGFVTSSDGKGCVPGPTSSKDTASTTGASEPADPFSHPDSETDTSGSGRQESAADRSAFLDAQQPAQSEESITCSGESKPFKSDSPDSTSQYDVVDRRGPLYEDVQTVQGRERAYYLLCIVDKKSTTSGASCYQRLEQAQKSCIEKTAEADRGCAENNEAMTVAADATKLIGVGSLASIQLACSKLGKLSEVANAGFGGYQATCSVVQKSCENSCTEARELFNQPGCVPQQDVARWEATIMPKVDNNLKTCVRFKEKISEAGQHAIAALAQLQASKQCNEDVLAANNVNECITNPTNPLCADMQKCSNPEFAASNQVCKCVGSPNLKECIATYGVGAGNRGLASGGLGNPNSSDGDGGGNTTMVGNQTPPGTSPFADALRNGASNGGDANLGGQKGNAGLGGGGGGSTGGAGLGNGSGAGGQGDPSDKLKINSGVYGGAAGGGMGYFGKPGSGGSLRANVGGVNFNKMNGAQFDPRRYITGMDGKREYVNGPNGDIFAIVKNRIDSKEPSLLDPHFKK